MPRKPQPQPISIPTLAMVSASRFPWGRGPDERLLGIVTTEEG